MSLPLKWDIWMISFWIVGDFWFRFDEISGHKHDVINDKK